MNTISTQGSDNWQESGRRGSKLRKRIGLCICGSFVAAGAIALALVVPSMGATGGTSHESVQVNHEASVQKVREGVNNGGRAITAVATHTATHQGLGTHSSTATRPMLMSGDPHENAAGHAGIGVSQASLTSATTAGTAPLTGGHPHPFMIIGCGEFCGGGSGSGSGSGGSNSVSFGPEQWGPPAGQSFSSNQESDWSNTPNVTLCVPYTSLCHNVASGVNVPVSDQNLQTGMTSVGAYTSGIATQAVQNGLVAYVDTPNTTGATHASDTVNATISVYTILASNNFGFLSNVNASIFQIEEDSPCDSQTQTPGVSTGVTIGLPDDGKLASAIEAFEGPIQNAVESAGSGSNLAQVLESVAGANLYQTTFTVSCSLPAGENVGYTVTPRLILGNAGIGATVAYAVSFVQISVSGTETPSVAPTTVQVVPSATTLNFNQPFSVTASVSPDPGDGTQIFIGYPTTLGGMVSGCLLSGGSCSVNFGPNMVPAGNDAIAAWWQGDNNHQGNSATTSIDVTQGTSSTTLSVSGPAVAGQPLTLGATVAPLTNMGSGQLGTVTFFSSISASPVGSCAPGYISGSCSITWTPAQNGTVQIQAAWSGDLDLAGSASQVQTATVYPAGPSIALTASPAAIGYRYQCHRVDGQVICGYVYTGDRATITATVFDNGVPAQGQTVSFDVTPASGVSLDAGTCTVGADGTCSVTLTVDSPPSSSTTYIVTASAAGSTGHTKVVYTVK